jgi:hypothetical protein
MAVNKAYLDTSAVSALVKYDIEVAGEMSALQQLLAWHESGKVVLLCSAVVEDELAKIPPEYIKAHRSFFDKFVCLPKANVGGLTQLGPLGLPMGNPHDRLMRSLQQVLHKNDAWHVFVASCNRLHYLITSDRKTMLSRKEAVFKISGVHLVWPSEFRNLQQ